MRITLNLREWCAAAFVFSLALAPAAKGQTLSTANTTVTANTATDKAGTPLPTVKEILERNDKATGGEAAWQKMTTRSMKGIYESQDDSSFLGVQILQKAPNKSVILYEFPNGLVVRDVCDGRTAWLEDPRGGYHAYSGAALASRLKRSEFSDRAKMLLLAATGKLVGTENVGAHTAYVIEFSPEKNAVSRVYFDAETGYLVREVDTYTTADGPYTVTLDMDDYREVDGVKVPFRMKRTEKGAVINIRLTQVKFNGPVDDSEFVKPESASN
jgi:zinc protease